MKAPQLARGVRFLFLLISKNGRRMRETGTLVQRQITKGEVKRAKSLWVLGTLREL